MVSSPLAIWLWNSVFIIDWKVMGELVSPKNITVGSYSPLLVVKAAFHSWPFFTCTTLYPHQISNFVKRVHSCRSMAWSQGCSGGNLFDSSSLNTLRYHWYWGGTHSLVSHSTFPFLIFISGSFIVLAENCAIATSAALRTMGNWEWSIHPHAQSILGCAVVNQGYPRIILWLPRSVRKYCKVTFLVPVLML